MSSLSHHFAGISIKRLSAVETERHTSNQHEFNGTGAMKGYLGLDRRVFPAAFIYLGENEEDRLALDDQVTWYDARERHPSRSEHRLYFRDNEVMQKAAEGDTLISALRHDGTMLLLILSEESPDRSEILWLFGMSKAPDKSFTTIDTEKVTPQSNALFNYVAESAGLEIEEDPYDNWLELMLDRFGPRFPKTRELSSLALETLGQDINAIEIPDESLVRLIDREEEMFRQLERHIVSGQLRDKAETWANDVDEFMQFSLGVHNRRKSRAGHALENHLEWIFLENGVDHQRGAQTENRSRPDFLFPGVERYQNPDWPDDKLTMLGVKTTCKDRWRQVLNEARRIPEKHLLTLQPGISEHQTTEMRQASLTLVLPRRLHETYSTTQTGNLMDVSEFIALVRERQSLQL
ncbi:EcoRII C terminal [Chromohalobacter canadensis]|uniref:EcoRII C terminal n=1 Tax=Chromohalobacter canadensis TaxID=141389 RepID=A0A285VIW9_9GAMM|nr:type II restriction endonuclease [Chromohalobacter canadensis]SOC54025.1 EcoRII C terminal [Chromohalobacter canadensis]